MRVITRSGLQNLGITVLGSLYWIISKLTPVESFKYCETESISAYWLRDTSANSHVKYLCTWYSHGPTTHWTTFRLSIYDLIVSNERRVYRTVPHCYPDSLGCQLDLATLCVFVFCDRTFHLSRFNLWFLSKCSLYYWSNDVYTGTAAIVFNYYCCEY